MLSASSIALLKDHPEPSWGGSRGTIAQGLVGSLFRFSVLDGSIEGSRLQKATDLLVRGVAFAFCFIT